MDAKEFVRIACSWASENRGVIWLVCGNAMELAARRLLHDDGFTVYSGATEARAVREGFADICVFAPSSGVFAGMRPPAALLLDGAPLVTDEAEIAAWLASTQKPAKVDPRTSYVLSDREVAAGTDPDSGLPTLDLRGLRGCGIDAPDQRYLIDPGAAIRVGSALLAAADPTLVPVLLKLATRAGEPFPAERVPASVKEFLEKTGPWSPLEKVTP